MNNFSTQFSVTPIDSFSIVDASQAAEQAIRNNDIGALRHLIDHDGIRSDTCTRDGSTLLMVAVRHRRLDAFNELIAQGFDAPRELRLSTPHEGNLIHCMVRYLDNRIFATPSSDPAWRGSLQSFFDQHGEHIDWSQCNWDQFDPHTLAHHLEQVAFADFLEPYMPDPEESPDESSGDSAKSLHLESMEMQEDLGMRPLTLQSFDHAFIPTHRMAMQAIADGDMTTLQQMIDRGEVRSRTRTADGTTLLMVAVQHRHLGAFNALLNSGFQAQEELELMNAHEGTLIHSMVRYLDDSIMATSSSHPAWRNRIHSFFNLHRQHILWQEQNWEGYNPLAMAESNHHDNWARFLRHQQSWQSWSFEIAEEDRTSRRHDFLGRKRG